VGLSYAEGATLMRALGARDAINLDGGGSVTMVVGGRVVNSPSDHEGERPVADSLEVVP
jgi:exopolysaccharide biosynthesis protein